MLIFNSGGMRSKGVFWSRSWHHLTFWRNPLTAMQRKGVMGRNKVWEAQSGDSYSSALPSLTPHWSGFLLAFCFKRQREFQTNRNSGHLLAATWPEPTDPGWGLVCGAHHLKIAIEFSTFEVCVAWGFSYIIKQPRLRHSAERLRFCGQISSNCGDTGEARLWLSPKSLWQSFPIESDRDGAER